MKKIKMVIGTINRLNQFISHSEQEDIYQNSYRPFIIFINENPNLKVVCYYSALLLQWLEEYHPEFILLLKELISEKRVELLASGFYEPAFNLIPLKDRKAQIEIMSNFIWQKFKTRCNGAILPHNIWEPSLASTFSNSGLKYIFLPSSYFFKSGVSTKEIYQPYLTEDQGRLISLFPIHDNFIERMGGDSPEKILKDITSLYTDNSDQIYLNLLIDGSKLSIKENDNNSALTNGWMKEFFKLIKENVDILENCTVASFYRKLKARKNIYLQCYQDSRLDGQMLSSDRAVIFNMLQCHFEDEGMSNMVQGGFFRQFLSRYKEAAQIYHKQHLVDLMINQNTKDKERKKSAREFLYSAQRGKIFSHSSEEAGIYHNSSRKKIYETLIEAEKTTRERGQFRSNLILADYNMDGENEVLYSGQNFNAYVDHNGAEIIELDYIPARWNYADTMKRYREAYHIDSEIKDFDMRNPNLFCDYFMRKDFSIEELNSAGLKDCSNFTGKSYEMISHNRDKKSVVFQTTGTILANGSSSEITLTKSYRFGKSIEVDYKIYNHSDHNLNFHFGSMLNLSFAEDSDDVQFSMLKKGTLQPLAQNFKNAKSITGFNIIDCLNSTQIDYVSSRTFSLYKEGIFTNVYTSEQFLPIFQHYGLLPIWNVSIRPAASWKIHLNLNLVKK